MGCFHLQFMLELSMVINDNLMYGQEYVDSVVILCAIGKTYGTPVFPIGGNVMGTVSF